MLSGHKVKLRPPTDDELDTIRRWENDAEISLLLGTDDGGGLRGKGQRRTEAWQRTGDGAGGLGTAGYQVLMGIFTSDGKLIGNVGISNITRCGGSGEVRMCIGDRELWGQGYGTDALTVFLRHVFLDLNLQYVYLRVYRHNYRAVRCYEKCGFRKEGFLRSGRSRRRGGYILMTLTRESFLGETQGAGD